MRAVSEAVPMMRDWWQRNDRQVKKEWEGSVIPLVTYQIARQELETLLRWDLETQLRLRLPDHLRLNGPTAAASTARRWRQRLEHQLFGDRLRVQHTVVTTRLADNWKLRQYIRLDGPTEGKIHLQVDPLTRDLCSYPTTRS